MDESKRWENERTMWIVTTIVLSICVAVLLFELPLWIIGAVGFPYAFYRAMTINGC
jgi:hypothetical protein